MSDTDILRAERWATLGDREAFRQLHDRHAAKVFAFARGMLPVHLAEEAVQMTFIKAAEKMSQFRGEAKFDTWLLSVARNVTRDLGRREKKRQRDVNYEAPERESLRPDETAESRELTELIRTAVLALPEPQREAVALCHLQEMRLAQAAVVMKMPLGTVKSHLHRGRETLKQSLAQYADSWL